MCFEDVVDEWLCLSINGGASMQKSIETLLSPSKLCVF